MRKGLSEFVEGIGVIAQFVFGGPIALIAFLFSLWPLWIIVYLIYRFIA